MPYPKPRVHPKGESLSQVKIRLVQEQRQRTLARQRQLLAKVGVDEDVQACDRAKEDDEFEERTAATESTEDKRVQTPTFISSRIICCGVCIVVCLSLFISVIVSITLFSFLERRQQLRDGL
jgi:hypothetical protein